VAERQSHQGEAQVATCQTHGMQTYIQLLKPGNLIFNLQQLRLVYGFNVGNYPCPYSVCGVSWKLMSV
jgi:hypothetical protein